MARISSALAALSVLACQVVARPQVVPVMTSCQIPDDDYQVTNTSKPYYGASKDTSGGKTCTAGPTGGCTLSAGASVSVGVTTSVEFGLDIAKILGASIGVSKSWSTDTTTSTSQAMECKGYTYDYVCGVIAEPKYVKTTGLVKRGHKDGCATDVDEYVPFEVVAPYLVPEGGGVNEDDNKAVNFRPCILECPGKAGVIDCPGVKEAIAHGIPLCQSTALAQQPAPGGWCTAHIVQHQRWQGIVGDNFRFDIEVLDGKKNSIYTAQNVEVDAARRISWKNIGLPKELLVRAGEGDNDPVAICYGDECFHCDDHDGGDNKCTLGNGNEYGWDNNKREGDFGFNC